MKATENQKEYFKKYYKSHKEERQLYFKKHYQENKEQIKIKYRNYYYTRREKAIQNTLNWQKGNQNKVKVYRQKANKKKWKIEKWKEWYRKRLPIKNAIRRTRLSNSFGQFTKQEWENLKRAYSYICPSCKKREPEIKLTIDHIIPLSKGGTNYISNIQPLCGKCNNHKYTKVMTFQPKKLVAT